MPVSTASIASRALTGTHQRMPASGRANEDSARPSSMEDGFFTSGCSTPSTERVLPAADRIALALLACAAAAVAVGVAVEVRDGVEVGVGVEVGDGVGVEVGIGLGVTSGLELAETVVDTSL